MKTFFISAGTQLVDVYYIPERGAISQNEHVCEAVEADTKGKARAAFCKKHHLEFTDRLLIRELHTEADSDGEWLEFHNAYLAACSFFELSE